MQIIVKNFYGFIWVVYIGKYTFSTYKETVD